MNLSFSNKHLPDFPVLSGMTTIAFTEGSNEQGNMANLLFPLGVSVSLW